MKRYSVEFTSEASLDLQAIFVYVAQNSSPDRARLFTQLIATDCLSLELAPIRGIPDRSGLRKIGIAKGRASVSFLVEQDRVIILSITAAGR